MPGLPRVPKSPTAVAFMLFKAWSALPPAQRRKLIAAGRQHGPRLAAKASKASVVLLRSVPRSSKPRP